jgi:hypothetical protein
MPGGVTGGCRAGLQGALFAGGLIQGSRRIFTGLGDDDHWTDVHRQALKAVTKVQYQTPAGCPLVPPEYSLAASYVRWLTDKTAIFC